MRHFACWAIQVFRHSAMTESLIDAFVADGSGGLNRPMRLAYGQDGNPNLASIAVQRKSWQRSSGPGPDRRLLLTPLSRHEYRSHRGQTGGREAP
jgi:hypothetical protein